MFQRKELDKIVARKPLFIKFNSDNKSRFSTSKPYCWKGKVQFFMSFKSLDSWERCARECTIGEQIGKGHFGKVFRGKDGEGREVAIKMGIEGRIARDEFLHEAELLAQCIHENVITLKGVSFDSKPYMIVLEFMPNGNLRDYLALNASNRHAVPAAKLIRIAQQVSKGMVYLSTKVRIVHRDLAARNVLLGSNLQAKITDFGLARQLPLGKQHYGPVVGFLPPIRWSAPEVVTKRIFSFKSDVWAFGIVLFEIASRGQRPFGDMSCQEIYPSILMQNSRDFSMLAELPRHCPPELASIMHSCWQKHQKDRPTFSEIFIRLTSMIPSLTKDGMYTYTTPFQRKTSRITAPSDYRPIVEVGIKDEERRLTPTEIIEWADKMKKKDVKVKAHADFAVSSQIGRGHFGDIFHGETSDGDDVAIKTIRQNSEPVEEFLREAEIISQFTHENTTGLVAVSFNPLWIVTEFMENADLRTFMVEKQANGQPLPHDVLTGIAQQVASGMVHVSDMRVIHQDVAARNVLVGASRKGSMPLVKVADFGLSHQLDENQTEYKPAKDEHVTFAIRWSAPEVISDYEFNFKSDVWSFGMILYEIMTHGEMPFKYVPDDQISTTIVHQDCQYFPMLANPKLSPEVCPEAIKNLMLMCWQKERRKRPSFTGIYEYFVLHLGQPMSISRPRRPTTSYDMYDVTCTFDDTSMSMPHDLELPVELNFDF